MQTANPSISVIIPAFNAARFIADTLDSVNRQTFKDFEVVVVDDGSTDNTVEIIEAWMEKDPRIRLIQQKNMGGPAARNSALSNARGKFIAPLDHDDVWFPRKLEKQWAVLSTAGPEVGLVYAWTLYLDEEGKPTGGYADHLEEGDMFLNMICFNYLANGSTPLFRRECITDCGIYRNEFSGIEDQDLFIRIASRYQFRVVPELLVGFRQVGSSLSRNISMMVSGHTRLMTDVSQRFPGVPSRVFNWSNGIFFAFMATRSFDRGDPLGALRFFATAVRHDPTVLLRAFMAIGRRTLAKFGRGRSASSGGEKQSVWQDSANLGSQNVNATSQPLGVFTKRRLAWIARMTPASRQPA